jgi:hypothetical protein
MTPDMRVVFDTNVVISAMHSMIGDLVFPFKKKSKVIPMHSRQWGWTGILQ